MCKTKPRIVSPSPAVRQRDKASRRAALKEKSSLPVKSSPIAQPSPAAKPSSKVKPPLTARPSHIVKPTLEARPSHTVKPTLEARPSHIVKPALEAKPSPIVKPPLTAKHPSTAAPRKKPVNTSSKVSLRPNGTTAKKLTLGSLLGAELENAKRWCKGFAHGTHYDAFLGMIRPDSPAILPYAELPNLQGTGRRYLWKQKGVFFRIVKKEKREKKKKGEIINSMGSTGASGGVILFMPLDKSLDLKLLSLSGTDTQTCKEAVTPSKAVFNSLETSGNLTTAEIAFGERIPLSYISKVFLLSGKGAETKEDKEEDAANWLLENGFREGESVGNSRGMYRHFTR